MLLVFVRVQVRLQTTVQLLSAQLEHKQTRQYSSGILSESFEVHDASIFSERCKGHMVGCNSRIVELGGYYDMTMICAL